MIHPNDEHRVHDLYSIGYNDREIARRTGYDRNEIRHWRNKNNLQSNVAPSEKCVSYKIALSPEQQPKMKRFLSLAAAVKPSGGIPELMKAYRNGHI